MTSILPRATAELLRIGKRDGSSPPVGVVIHVAKREDLALAGRLADELLVFARNRLAKATLPRAIAERDAAMAEVGDRLQDDLVRYFDGLLERAGVRKDDAFPLDADGIDWKAEVRILREVLASVYLDLGELAYAAVGDELAIELAFDLEGPSTSGIRNRLADQVARITDHTREILRDRVETAVARGYSIEQLVAGVDDMVGLRDLFGTRARTIALTETANAYNHAALEGYAQTGLVDTVRVFDGADCGWTSHDDPDLANGSERTLDDARDHVISHPRCQRAFGAVAAR